MTLQCHIIAKRLRYMLHNRRADDVILLIPAKYQKYINQLNHILPYTIMYQFHDEVGKLMLVSHEEYVKYYARIYNNLNSSYYGVK